jgi:hypothetical protein
MDAVMQFVLLLVVPLGLVLAVLTASLPLSGAHIHLRNLLFIGFALCVVLPVTFWTGKRFGHYKRSPQAASFFRSHRERTKSILAFVALALVVVTFLALSTMAGHA